MNALPDLVRAADLIAARGSRLGRPLHILAETTSTNDEAKRAARLGAPHGSTWVAESQTAGRGRQGRRWISARGESLLFSVLFRHSGPLARMPLVSLAAGLAIAEAVERASPTASVRVKWPNDVVIADAQGLQLAKIAGILAETSTTGSSVDAIVVGVGINVLTRCFPDELAELATSVTLVADRVPDRAEILADALAGLDRDVPVVLAKGLGPLHDRLARKDALAGRLVRSDASYGIARGIDAEGRLVVEREGRREAWSSGEVHLVSSSPAERREGGSL